MYGIHFKAKLDEFKILKIGKDTVGAMKLSKIPTYLSLIIRPGGGWK